MEDKQALPQTNEEKMAAIMEDLLPTTSRKQYERAWFDFDQWLKKNDFPTGVADEPTESAFVLYFKYLREEKQYKPSTLWSRYSMLNTHMKISWGKLLGSHAPRLSMYFLVLV